MRALSPAPDKRFPTAEELRRELVAFERQSDLDLSEGPIAQWMARLFGPQPVPTVDAIPDLEEPPGSGRSMLRAAVPWVAATAAFLLGAVVWEQARPTPDARQAATTEPLSASAMVSEPERAPEPVGAADAPAPSVVDTPTIVEAQPVAEPQPVGPTPSPAATPPSAPEPVVESLTKPSTKRRRPKTTRTRTKPAKDDRWRSTLPPSLRGSK